MSKDKAAMQSNMGSRLSRVTPIRSGQTIKDRVSRTNRADLFSFNLDSPSNLNLKFRSSGRGASISLVQDRNQNGLVDSGETIKTTSIRPGREKAIDSPGMAAGTYYVQVSTTGRGNNNYRFTLTSSAQPSTGNTGDTGTQSNTGNPFIQQVVDLTNQFRKQNGLSALTLNSQLSAAAYKHSQDMAFRDFFDHTNPDGTSFDQRITTAGYRWSTVAENIAAGYPTAAEVVQGWIDSPGHRANMLKADLTEIGIGYFFLANDTGNTNYNHYWTQNFGRPR